MGRYLTITPGLLRPGVRRRTIGPLVRFGPISTHFLTVVLIAILALFYLVLQNIRSTRGYTLLELEDRKRAAEVENSRLRIEAARERSIRSFEESNSRFQPPQTIYYLEKAAPVAGGARIP